MDEDFSIGSGSDFAAGLPSELDEGNASMELQKIAYQTYQDVWDDFYTWETEECRNIIRSLSWKFNRVPPRLPNLPPQKPSFRSAKPDVQKFKIEDYDPVSSRQTTDMFDVEPFCVYEENQWGPYARYTTCTSISHNTVAPRNAQTRTPFLPYSDEPRFLESHPKYLRSFRDFAWQKDMTDPDRNMIQFEAAYRLIEKHNLSFEEVDQLGMFTHKLRGSNKEGLMWDSLQRDPLSWPGLHLSEYRKNHSDFVNPDLDLDDNVSRDVLSFCPRFSCLTYACSAHADSGPGAVHPPKATINHKELFHDKAKACSNSCYKVIDLEDENQFNEHWDDSDRSLFNNVIKYMPDTLPCHLAVLCRKPCFEMFIARQNVFQYDDDFAEADVAEEQDVDVDYVDDVDIQLQRPCSHFGPCTKLTKCKCFEANQRCHRDCRCSRTCPRRYKGCKCRTSSKTGPCLNMDKCECMRLGRECDPEVCIGCDARGMYQCSKIHYKPKHSNKKSRQLGCQNNNLIQANHGLIRISPSTYGLGAFTVNPIAADIYFGEYVGEVSHTETAFTMLQKYANLNYTFEIEKGSNKTLDSWFIGNETRYLNDSKPNPPNCGSRLMYVDGDHRIGIHTLEKNVAAGRELFLAYGDTYWLQKD